MIRYGLLNLMFLLLCLSAEGQELVVKEKDGLYGFFIKKTMLLDFQYDSIDQQSDGAYAVRKDGKWGLISTTGKESIPCQFDFLYRSVNSFYTASYQGKVGLLDTTGTIILDFLFDEIDYVEKDTQVLAKYEGKWCLYKNGTFEFDDAGFVFHTLDTMPLFPGCQQSAGSYEDLRTCSSEKMYQQIFSTIKYPVDARRKGIQGQVIVQFTVTSEGKIQDPVIRRGLGGGCDEEVIRVVNGMPDWIPARRDGKNVATIFTLPVKFVLGR